MIRTIVTPKNTDLLITIPENYVGKQVEVLIYPTDEISEDKTLTKSPSLRGKLQLSDEQYQDFHLYLANTRREWNRDI